MQGNIIGQSESSSGLNVYAQLNEPSKKDGVWIKTAEVKPNVLEYVNLANIPENFTYSSAVEISINIYLFGGVEGKSNYKYNILTNTYTKLSNIPYEFNYGSVVAIGTNIYLFGGSGHGDYQKYAYKYDTLTDTYARLANIPFSFFRGSAVAIENDIYLLNGSNKTYKYNTLTNTYVKIVDIPCGLGDGSAVAIGTDIYSLGYNNIYNYKYDTLTNTCVQLADIPYIFSGSLIAVNTDIYLFGGVDTFKNYAYRYDTLTNKYIQLTNIPYDFGNGSIISINSNIYLFGSDNNTYGKNAYKIQLSILSEMQKFKYDKVELVDDISNIAEYSSDIYIETKQLFKILLTKKLEIHFSNAYINIDNELLEYIVYYGDGTRWRRIDEKDDLQNLVTEDGNQIITEDGKIIKV